MHSQLSLRTGLGIFHESSTFIYLYWIPFCDAWEWMLLSTKVTFYRELYSLHSWELMIEFKFRMDGCLGNRISWCVLLNWWMSPDAPGLCACHINNYHDHHDHAPIHHLYACSFILNASKCITFCLPFYHLPFPNPTSSQKRERENGKFPPKLTLTNVKILSRQ